MSEYPGSSDVVVVGGGIAGFATATQLARDGYDVVLFEKQKHPRYQVGESTIPHIWRHLERIGVSEKIAADGFIEKAGGTVVWDGVIRQMAFKDFAYDRPAMHIERERFDHILLQHAAESGARIFEETNVQRVELGAAGGPRIHFRPKGAAETRTIQCRWVVDASGQNALLGRQLGLREIDDAFRFMSVWGFFDNSKYVAPGGKIHPYSDLATVPPTTFISSLETVHEWGWLWHIPLRPGTSVGLVLPRESVTAIRDSDEELEAFFVRTCHETPLLDRLLSEATFMEGTFRVIRNYSYTSKDMAGPGFFIVGDAAAFVDPIFALGTVFAMYSGCLAGMLLDSCLRRPAETERFQEIYRSQVHQRVELARALALPAYQPSGFASDQARAALQFASAQEWGLINAATMLTQRNENFLEMARSVGGEVVPSDKFRVLEGLG